MYNYKAYGLTFSSELILPELEQVKSAPDVIIRIGLVPKTLKEVVCKSRFFQVNKNEFLFSIGDCAAYYVKDGKEITIEPYKDISNPDIRLFLLGSVFGALLQQRGFLVLHGATVVINGKGVLFTGKSGVGKSTLAGALHKKNYSILTDDVSAVKLGEDGTPYVFPGFPSLKLWQDAAQKLDTSITGLEPVISNRKKYRVDILNYYNSSVSLNEVYILGIHDDKRIKIEPVFGMEKLDKLIQNTYRYCYLNGQVMKAQHFKQCVAVAQKVNVFRVWRPRDGFMIRALSDAVEKNVFRDA